MNFTYFCNNSHRSAIALVMIDLKQAMSTTGYAYALQIFILSFHAIARE
ncbi:hypothetical protein H6G81_29970 [Scytonema hofmannii FACHB-248]|uniref:Uncharacterized protein n=1 Tax=Scytonema hofmannii FACHB-248 TaxID=1842502 RepID=A0ABR8GZL0_9CYAN|nr:MULTISPECIES: hypothetical protein [Nostocales]MBD2608632.1 hypothetical protein [Scytonema hofmannii FACHB-248]